MYARKLPLAALFFVGCLLGPPEDETSSPSHAAERRACVQPTVPPEYREVPYVESAPEPELTDQEQQRGYVLFQRPITQPVYPNTRPLPHERLQQLSAFATPGEYEPVTLSLYPVRALQNVRVRVSDLQCGTSRIASDEVEVRLATYWNVGFPRYTSRDTYRRLPELLERVTVHSSTAGECQRWWLTIHVPEHAKPGLYHGQVTITDEASDQRVTVPLAMRVLSFSLQSDPAKHYSVYYYTRNNVIFRNKPESFVERATGNEYAAMIRYGIDTLPTMSLQTDSSGRRIELRDEGELDRMLAAGLGGPLPLTAGNVIGRIYRDTTPGGKRESHWLIDTMPPTEFYERITEMFADFERLRQAKGWPPVVCCPIDEVAASRSEFGARVYAAVQQAGIRTYATKNPLAADAAVYRPYVDVWCSQPYSTSYEKIQRRTSARVLVLPEPQRGRDQGPARDVQRWADDLRLRLLAQRLHDADPLALGLDTRSRPVRLSARHALRLRPADRRRRRGDSGDLLGVFSRGPRRCPLSLHAAASGVGAGGSHRCQVPASGGPGQTPAAGDLGRHRGAAEVPGRRHVAGHGVSGSAVADSPGH